MGMLSGIGSAVATEGGNYIAAGLGVAMIDVLKGVESRKGDDLFCAELLVIENSNDKQGVGSHVTWMANLRHDAALGNIKSFLKAATGLEEIDDDDAEESIDEEKNPCHGKFIKFEATQIKTKAGNDFTKVRWETPSDEEIKAYTKAAKKLS